MWATRSNFWLRMVRPDQVQNFAERHDLNVWRCLQALLGIEGAPDLARMLSNLPLSRGGLGLSCAARSTVAAHWSSWADCVHMIKQRHPEVAEIMLTGIDHEVAPCFQAVRDCADTLREAGLVMPTWRVLADTPPTRDLQAEPAEPQFGWQHRAASCLEEQFLTTLWPTFTDAQKALLRSQRGPLASQL